LRDYGHDGQIGLEETPEAYVAKMVEVFREVKRVLRDDGTLWLNLGDSYNGNRGRSTSFQSATETALPSLPTGHGRTVKGLGNKQLLGIPWRVAFALQQDGWYLRQDIIWHKPNPMPESVRDRCTKAHEYVFLLSKSERYYFDLEAISEPVASATVKRLSQRTLAQQTGSSRVPGKTNGPMKAVGNTERRNRRSVWSVATKPYKGAHFATYPPELIRPCILASCPKGGTVLDPFGGSGTTAQVAIEEGRNAVLCELNPAYIELAKHRLAQVQPPHESQMSTDPAAELADLL
jgi:DNA modification methylase